MKQEKGFRMKRNTIKGLSATVASLALVGTCFAGTALAEESTNVFASTDTATESTEATDADVESNPALATSQTAPVTLTDDEANAIVSIMSALGFDDTTIEQVLNGDLSGLDVSDADIDQMADQLGSQITSALEDAGITGDMVDSAVSSLSTYAESFAQELEQTVAPAIQSAVDSFTSYLTEQGVLTENMVLFSGDSTLASDSAAQTVSYEGLNFLVPSDYSVVSLTGDELAAAFKGDDASDSAAANAFTDGMVAVNADSQASVIVCKLNPENLEDFGSSNLAAAIQCLPFLSAAEQDTSVAFGGATLDDGTPVLAMGYSSSEQGYYEVVLTGSTDGGIVAFVAYASAQATQDDNDQLSAILSSLTGVGPIATGSAFVVDGDENTDILGAVEEAVSEETAEVESVPEAAEAEQGTEEAK